MNRSGSPWDIGKPSRRKRCMSPCCRRAIRASSCWNPRTRILSSQNFSKSAVHRIVSTVDAAGWRPTKGELDRYGREIPDGEYGTKDFDHLVALKARTEAIARNLSDFMKNTDRFGKTIVFCVDQEHAEEMRKALNNCRSEEHTSELQS